MIILIFHGFDFGFGFIPVRWSAKYRQNGGRLVHCIRSIAADGFLINGNSQP